VRGRPTPFHTREPRASDQQAVANDVALRHVAFLPAVAAVRDRFHLFGGRIKRHLQTANGTAVHTIESCACIAHQASLRRLRLRLTQTESCVAWVVLLDGEFATLCRMTGT